jgi:hypothetical protein
MPAWKSLEKRGSCRKILTSHLGLKTSRWNVPFLAAFQARGQPAERPQEHRAAHEGQEIHGKPAGSVMAVEFEIEGQKFVGLNSGPQFKFSEAISPVSPT